MLNFILQPLAEFIIYIISVLGYTGLFIAMTLQSACIPLPSEIILPFSGFLVSQGVFDFWLTVLTATIGSLTGSILAFSLGFFKGEVFVRSLIKKYGKYILVFEYELDDAERWFRKYGEIITFVSRLLPVIRTFIALPAGISKMNFTKFCLFVVSGDFLWSMFLVYIGKVFGGNWDILGNYFHKFDFIIVILGMAAFLWYIQHKMKRVKQRG